jgi:hypothetical protein
VNLIGEAAHVLLELAVHGEAAERVRAAAGIGDHAPTDVDARVVVLEAAVGERVVEIVAQDVAVLDAQHLAEPVERGRHRRHLVVEHLHRFLLPVAGAVGEHHQRMDVLLEGVLPGRGVVRQRVGGRLVIAAWRRVVGVVRSFIPARKAFSRGMAGSSTPRAR